MSRGFPVGRRVLRNHHLLISVSEVSAEAAAIEACYSRQCRVPNILQNDFNMRAAFSHSLSSVVGQNASRASREERDDGILSAQPRTFSMLFLRAWPLVKLLALDLLRSQLGVGTKHAALLSSRFAGAGKTGGGRSRSLSDGRLSSRQIACGLLEPSESSLVGPGITGIPSRNLFGTRLSGMREASWINYVSTRSTDNGRWST